MKTFEVFAATLLGLLSMQLIEACGPYKERIQTGQSMLAQTTLPLNKKSVSKTKELGYRPFLRMVKLGVRRGMMECEKQFKESPRLNCSIIRKLIDPKSPIFLNTTLPLATRETAFIHAISSAAIAYEMAIRCQHGGTKKQGRCSNIVEFGQDQTMRFFENLEQGHGARTAVNLHNNKVGREVVEGNQTVSCKCHDSNCDIQTCYQKLAPFQMIGAELKQKYHNAVRVLFLKGKLYERIGDQFRAISSEDNRLVYLDPSPDFCVRNDTLGTPGMLGRICRSDDVTKSDCESFKTLCSSCKFRYETNENFEQYMCNCKFIWCCHVKCQTCTRKFSLTTCFANREQSEF